jgi:PAS domain S-box-containing protein
LGFRRRRTAADRARPGTRVRPGISLKAYLAGLVLLLVGVAAANAVYQRQEAIYHARQDALVSTGYGARDAARQITAALGSVQAQVAELAADLSIPQTFGPRAECALQFQGSGPFTTGHLDIIAGDGIVACSSLAPRQRPGYAGAKWLAAALRGPLVTGPVLDTQTRQLAEVVAAPVPGQGVVAVFLNLAPVGPQLALTLSGPRQLEFVVTTANGATVVARSIRPDAWVGKQVPGTPFAGAAGQAEHRDLDGTPRLYGQALVAKSGWRVFAGDSNAQAFAAANQAINRQVLVTLIALLGFLLAALVLYRRIGRPIASLSAGVRDAASQGSAVPIAAAGPAELLALTENVNHLIGMASRQQEASSMLAAVAESSTDAILGVTLDGVITAWNAGAERITGYSRAEMIGSNLSVLAPPGLAGEQQAILDKLRRGERVERVEVRRLRKDNTIVDLSYTISPIRDAGGALVGAATVARDITEFKRAEAERRSLERRSHQSERLESLGQLASGIAHDFNNLLSAIMSYAEFVADETADRPAVQADAQEIQAAAERGARLTRQLLLFSRAEPAQLSPLDVNAVVADISSLLSRTIGDHIELNISPAAGLPAIQADRGRVEQVLLNLAINARDAMPDGGVVTIGTSLTELDDSYANAHPGTSPGLYVELTVADTGTGMSPEVAARIFEPFFSTKPRGQGTGLGLSTVYGIVTQVGGRIRAESEEGTGTTFHVYFPAALAAADAAPDHPTAPAGSSTGDMILVVDDQPAVLVAASRILRQHGYATLEAATYEEALELASAYDFRLLLTDSLMPHMSGLTLAERIAEFKPDVAVLYMSGKSQSESAAGPGRGRAKAILRKPFTSQALLAAVSAAMEDRPGQD